MFVSEVNKIWEMAEKMIDKLILVSKLKKSSIAAIYIRKLLFIVKNQK